MYLRQSEIRCFAACTCRKTFNLSNGAVHVLETAPAMPPAAKCLHHMPVCISLCVKSSGTLRSSPMSRYRSRRSFRNM
uniref:Uncharacterized protein n=1 Tax=Nyssomyia neivai TaxID=330878 RepID=A0A1L8D7U3_9DIPT